MKKILIAEDEKNIREFVVINLQRAGYVTFEAENGDEALRIYDEEGRDFHIVILDIMMPGTRDGLAVGKVIREYDPSVGIIMLSAKTQEIDKISGLMMGADDYITKPFSPSELLARVDAVYRRVSLIGDKSAAQRKAELTQGEFVLNQRNRTFHKADQPIELTQVEFQIMEYFFTNPGVALGRSDLLKHVWGPAYVGEEKIVDVNIRRLRMKVEDEPSNPKHIVTVWGLGYRWDT